MQAVQYVILDLDLKKKKTKKKKTYNFHSELTIPVLDDLTEWNAAVITEDVHKGSYI